ncbi:MAG: hypothetical protein KF708_19740 [Pirellulales bacterium]|nr:hypothetical protein [Pirellulales bacterium]
MQSGPIVLVRAVVMLTCMIVVPLVAIFWKHWPEAIDLARQGEWSELADMGLKIVTQSGPQPSTTHEPSQEAPAFAADASSAAALAANASSAPATTAALGANPPAALTSAPPQMLSEMTVNNFSPPAQAPPAVATVGYTAPVGGSAMTPSVGTSLSEAGETAQAMPAHFAHTPPLPSPGPGNDAPQANPFRDMEQRLRALGATYYLLESWGTTGNLYRFHVKMALAGNPSYNRHFEATDADPMMAMRHVLSEVEAWRNGQQL